MLGLYLLSRVHPGGLIIPALVTASVFVGVSRRTCPGDESNAISTDETLEVEGIQCALTKEDELVMSLGFKPLKNGGWKTILTFPFGEAI